MDDRAINLPAGFALCAKSMQAGRERLAAVDAARRAGARSMQGEPSRSVRYIRSTFAPEDGRCMCLFEARSAEDVKKLNDEAKLPYSRVVEALDLTP